MPWKPRSEQLRRQQWRIEQKHYPHGLHSMPSSSIFPSGAPTFSNFSSALFFSHIDILHLHLSHLLHPSFLRESYSLLQFPSPFLRQGRRLLQRLTSTRCWLCDLVMSQTLGSLSLRLEFTGRLALQGRGCVGVGAGRHDLHRSGFNNELIYLPQVSYCAQRWRPIRLGANAVRCADDVGGMAGAGLRLNCLGFSTTLLGSSDGMTFTILAV